MCKRKIKREYKEFKSDVKETNSWFKDNVNPFALAVCSLIVIGFVLFYC